MSPGWEAWEKCCSLSLCLYFLNKQRNKIHKRPSLYMKTACEPHPNDLCRPDWTYCSHTVVIISLEGRNLTLYFPETFPLLCVFPSSFRFLSFIISSPSGWVTHPPPARSTGLLVCLNIQTFRGNRKRKPHRTCMHTLPPLLPSNPSRPFPPSAAMPCSLCNPFRSAAARLALSHCQ